MKATEPRHPDRRQFVIGSAAGALVVGCSLAPTGGRVWRYFQHTGEFQPNAWIRILADDTIIFTLDRVEMGQGTMTSHAALVCEELEVDPRKLRIEHAAADRAYDNPDREIRIQITGGSTSTRTSWQPLREAGAVAREMLRAAAAAQWGVARDQCTAEDGAIIHRASGRRARYGELVAAAARQDIPRVTLKPASEFRWIGKSLDRLDARAKVDGSAIYGLDIALPGMVTAVLVRPPVRGARLVTLDDRAARARPGVIDVVRIGEAIAVVGEGYWEARTGAEQIAAEWEGGAVVDSANLFASYEQIARGSGRKVARKHGGAVGAAGGPLLEAIYRVPYLAHATMEPQNATASIDRGRCHVWAPTQTPGVARWRVADAIGFDLRDVAIHTTMLGGGFGRRGLVDYAVEAAQVAHKIGRPVKVVWSREDDQANDWYRPMAVSRLVGALDNTRKIAGWYHHVVAQTIIASEGGDFVGAIVPNATPRGLRRALADSFPRATARAVIADPTSVEGAADLPYAIPRIRVEYSPVDTGIPVGFWRSVGHSINAFAVESFLDELAHAAGADPVALRKQLLVGKPRHLRTLERAAEAAKWGSPLPAGVGRGVAVHESFKSVCALVVEASLDGRKVKVHRVVAAIDCGRAVNPGLIAAQLESAVIFGLSAALKQEITFARGRVEQLNFQSYRSLRMYESPIIESHIVASDDPPTGVGEPGVPPVAPALCNAIFAASGKRIRSLPIEAALATVLIAGLAAVGSLRSLASADTPRDNDPFATVYAVLQHPRCMNCHPNGDAPLQYDDHRPHGQNITRRSEANGLPCQSCHRAKNGARPGQPPGAPHWQLPPAAAPMIFQGRSPRQLCEQLNDPRQTGGRDLAALLHHVEHDPLVAWGWAPGPGRTPVAVPRDRFVAAFKAWVGAGGACPDR